MQLIRHAVDPRNGGNPDQGRMLMVPCCGTKVTTWVTHIHRLSTSQPDGGPRIDTVDCLFRDIISYWWWGIYTTGHWNWYRRSVNGGYGERSSVYALARPFSGNKQWPIFKSFLEIIPVELAKALPHHVWNVVINYKFKMGRVPNIVDCYTASNVIDGITSVAVFVQRRICGLMTFWAYKEAAEKHFGDIQHALK